MTPTKPIISLVLAAAAAALVMAMPAAAATQAAEKAVSSGGKPAKVEAVAVHMTAVVQGIDYKTREVTLKGNGGEPVTVTAGPEVKRLNEIRKGDLLDVEYIESIAVSVQKPDSKMATVEGAQSVLVRGQTENPSGRQVDTETFTATVEAVDLENRTADLIGPNGRHVKVNVAPDVPNLDAVKKGDVVVVRHTRTMALSIRKPEKPS
jgi:hypothetical protein